MWARMLEEMDSKTPSSASMCELRVNIEECLLIHLISWLYGNPLGSALSVELLLQLAELSKRLQLDTLYTTCLDTFQQGVHASNVCRLWDELNLQGNQMVKSAKNEGNPSAHGDALLQLTAEDLTKFQAHCISCLISQIDLQCYDAKFRKVVLEASLVSSKIRDAAKLHGWAPPSQDTTSETDITADQVWSTITLIGIRFSR